MLRGEGRGGAAEGDGEGAARPQLGGGALKGALRGPLRHRGLRARPPEVCGETSVRKRRPEPGLGVLCAALPGTPNGAGAGAGQEAWLPAHRGCSQPLSFRCCSSEQPGKGHCSSSLGAQEQPPGQAFSSLGPGALCPAALRERTDTAEGEGR